MRKQLVDFISQDNELKQFLRKQPIWFRRLSRNPYEIRSFQYAAKFYYQKTFPQRVEKISNSIELATIMLQMFHAMKNYDE